MTTTPAYPLAWPAGWKRTAARERVRGRFSAGGGGLTIARAIDRVRGELRKMARAEDVVISTDLELRRDGLPYSGQREPDDPGAAAYWRDRTGATRCMAIDRYSRVADNLAAIAATLDAMRAIERHGGAEILDRAFTGFTALPSPETARPWHVVLGGNAHSPTEHVRELYRKARSANHPDKGGSAEIFAAIQNAWDQFCAERGIEA